ncbi:MAG: radical SAM protein [Bacillota bacterium]
MSCNRSCSYCFAKEKLHSYSKPDSVREMSLENLDAAMLFLAKSNQDTIQLAGGEPTIHSKFKEIVLKLLSNNMRVNVLSNALWDPGLNDFFAQISPLSLGFLLNIDHPKTYTPAEWTKIEKNLSFLKSRSNITLSFNIREAVPDYSYIFELISKYGFKFLRLSFSMPVRFDDRKNSYLPIAEYKNAAKYVVDFIRKAEALGAKAGMDNAVPICMFTAEELNELMLKQVIEPARNFVCYPAIDIGPDLSIWRCFGTSKLFNKKLSDFSDLLEVYDYYERVSRLYQFKFFPLEECASCNYGKEEKCQGGCIGFAESKAEELGREVSDLSDEKLFEAKPRLAKEVVLRRYQLPREAVTLQLPNGNEIEIPKIATSLILQLDGETSVKKSLAHSLWGNSASEESDGLDDCLLELSGKKVLPIIRRLLEQKALVTTA